MKLKLTFFCLLASSLSCMLPPGYQQGAFPSQQVGQQGAQQPGGGANYIPNNIPPDRSDEDYENMKNNDRNRDQVLSRSKSRRKGDDCGDEAKGHECISLCREIYKRRDDRDDCEDLTVPQVYALADVYDVLEDPDEDALRELDVEDVKVFLNLSIAGLDNLIREYSKNDAKNVLTWIAEDEDIAEELEDGDDDSKTLEKLLLKISKFSETDVEKPFGVEIDSDLTLFELAFNADNESAVDWFLYYVFDKSNHCAEDVGDDGNDIECITVICKIGHGFEDEGMREVVLDFDSWSDFLGLAIKNSRNSGAWCPDTIRTGNTKPTSVEDLEDLNEGDWVKTLCKGKPSGFNPCS